MDFNQFVNLLQGSGVEWLRVNDNLCVHAFIGDFDITLCRYRPDDKYVIRVDVDDSKNNYGDILLEDYTEGTDEYGVLLPFYNAAIQTANPAVYA